MKTLHRCRGLEALTHRLDRAVAGRDLEEVTRDVQDVLTQVIQSGDLELPAEVKAPAGDSYARRLLHESEEHDYVVIAMIWGPGQGTALHDHDGVWCVEGVLEGEIDVTQYQPLDWTRDGRWRFEPAKSVRAEVGSSGSLIPPFEYHTIANAHDDGTAITIHVYGQELERANIFEPLEEKGWYRRRSKELGYTH